MPMAIGTRINNGTIIELNCFQNIYLSLGAYNKKPKVRLSANIKAVQN